MNETVIRGAAELRAHVVDGVLRDVSVTGDLTGDALVGVHTLVNVRFHKVDMADATLTKTELRGCLFQGGRLVRTTFTGAVLEDTVFDHVVMNDVGFAHAELQRTALLYIGGGGDVDVVERGAVVDLRAAVMRDVELTSVRLLRPRFTDARCEHLVLRDSQVHDALFDSAHLVDCSVAGCELHGAVFDRAELEHVELDGALCPGASFEEACLVRCSLADTVLTDAVFKHAVVDRSTFTSAVLLSTCWRTASLASVNFDNANMAGAMFDGAALTGVRFVNTVLGGASFVGATMDCPVLNATVPVVDDDGQVRMHQVTYVATVDQLQVCNDLHGTWFIPVGGDDDLPPGLVAVARHLRAQALRLTVDALRGDA